VAAHRVDERGENFALTVKVVIRERPRCGAVKNLRFAGDGFVEGCAPTGEATLLDNQLIRFVGHIIDQAHECVERDDTIALRLGKKKNAG